MAEISLWAPEAHEVRIESGEWSLELFRKERGWWGGDVPFLVHGADYAFRIDGKGPYPDPASPWQPDGPHGPSRWVDHTLFRWTDEGWRPPPLKSAIIYELHIGTFTPEGTFESAVEKLGYLADLGITHVEIMPVAEFSGKRGWGYDGVDLYSPYSVYGGPEGLKRFVDACHRRGIAVLLDVVYNHLGPSGNYLEAFGPYFTSFYSTPWGKGINFDGPESDTVRRFFLDNALMWLRNYHLDGLRLDAVHAIFDRSAVHFLEELAAEVKTLEKELKRPLVLIAESDLNDPRIVRHPEKGGYGLDAQWNEDYHHSLFALLTGDRSGYYSDFGSLEYFVLSLTSAFVYDGRYSAYRRRRHGRSPAGLPGEKFVACLQNHDQIGNRASGERTGHLLTPGQLMIGAALLLTGPFVPLLFQGEEWGCSSPFLYFTDHFEPDLAEGIRTGRLREFAPFVRNGEVIPDPQAEETFIRSKLRWSEQLEEPRRTVLQWHRSLIKLRNSLPELTDGVLENISLSFDEDEKWLLMNRGRVSVACNFSGERLEMEGIRKANVLLASEEPSYSEEGVVFLPPRSVLIVSCGEGKITLNKME